VSRNQLVHWIVSNAYVHVLDYSISQCSGVLSSTQVVSILWKNHGTFLATHFYYACTITLEYTRNSLGKLFGISQPASSHITSYFHTFPRKLLLF